MRNKIRYYDSVLRKNKCMDFHTPAERMIQDFNTHSDNKFLYETTAFMTAPVLVSYVIWVLDSARKKGIRRLYFLARDGYIMYQIALTLCRAYHLNIDCRYFYCSRYALRMPLFLIDREEALDKVCINGYCVTAEIVLDRVGLDKWEKEQVFSELGIESKKQILSKAGLAELRQRLEHSDTFLKLALKRSNESYSMIYSYFLQEGFFDSIHFAIVDSGWSGSMQRSIRRILEYAGKEDILQGFYFGMYEMGKPEDGQYYCYYFSSSKHYFRSINFNNNLFECLCSANHGMTIGYEKNNEGRIVPILNLFHFNQNTELQLKVLQNFAVRFVENNSVLSENNISMVHFLLKSFMGYPCRAEADFYGGISFCDDSTEKYMVPLADRLSMEDIRQQLISTKVIRKFKIKKAAKTYKESFWIQGTLARYKYPCTKLLNVNFKLSIFIYSFLKYLKIGKI